MEVITIAENTLKKSIERLKNEPVTEISDVIKLLQSGLHNIRREQTVHEVSLDEFNRAVLEVAEAKSSVVNHYRAHSVDCFTCLKGRISSGWFGDDINELIEWVQNRYIRYINESFPQADISLLKKTITAVADSTKKKQELSAHVVDHIQQSNCSFKELCETCEFCLFYQAVDGYGQHPIAKRIAERWLREDSTD